MVDHEGLRPNPDVLLGKLSAEEVKKSGKGKLKIFLGYAAGVGKTYSMLDEAQQLLASGVDVVAGYVEPHTRPETLGLLDGLPQLPEKELDYRNIKLKEFDLDGALARKPQVLLVDELAHTNAEGVRNKKRYQDVEELLNAGIDVFTTVNIQHIESLNDVIYGITRVYVRETIPDYIFDDADLVVLIDIEPEELIDRLMAGKIYKSDRATAAMQNFFTKEKLRLLREMALRKTADRVSHETKTENPTLETSSKVKLLVCISASPSSARCIRWAARNADAFHATWTAAYVETPADAEFNEKTRKAIHANMDLAERMGAETVTLVGNDAAHTIAEYAKLSGVTNIVVGKNRTKKTLRNYFKTAFEDKLVFLLSDIEIHIIPDNSTKNIYRKSFKNTISNNFALSWKDTGLMAFFLILATVISLSFKALAVNDRSIIMIYILSVLIISRTTSGYFYGLTSSILCALMYNFLFLQPYYTFTIIQEGYPLTFVIMILVALITSALTARVKTQARLATERGRRTEMLYEINKKLLATRGEKEIVELTNQYILNLFDCSSIIYTKDPAVAKFFFFKQNPHEPDASFLVSEEEQAVAHWVFVNHKQAGKYTNTLMGANGFYIPVISQSKVLGVIGIDCVDQQPLTQNNRFVLRMIGSQLAMALERQNLSDQQRRMQIETEKEKMRSNLLRAISHDLRTPLTGILGSSSVLLESNNKIDAPTQVKLIQDIKEDAQWLIRMVENLLSVTRINEGTMNVTKIPEAVEEIVAEAVRRIKTRTPNQDIQVTVPNELLIVPMDGTLIEQVLLNLIENAIKHSGKDGTIDIHVQKVGRNAVFEISDNGDGIPKEDLPHLFDGISLSGTKNVDASRGIGIGLSICMSIIKSHGGKMEAENKPAGGALFRFTLPI